MNRYYRLWLLAVTLTALASAGAQSMLEERKLLSEARVRATTIVHEFVNEILANNHSRRFERIAKNLEQFEASSIVTPAVTSLGICAFNSKKQWDPSRSISFPRRTDWNAICQNKTLNREIPPPTQGLTWHSSEDHRLLQYSAYPLNGAQLLTVIIAQDLSPLKTQWMKAFFRSFGVTWALGSVLLFIFWLQTRGWIQRDLKKLHNKLLTMTSTHRDSDWLAKLKESMGSKKLTIIANREPYIHQQQDDKIQVIRPASGLVTALEPILRQCGGLWIAHGSGSADRQVVDAQNEVAVPPQNPRYRLRRVWLTPEEEKGYYYGFSNEGFWPLCHYAHTRPIFRLPDWEHYKTVNQKFADQIPERSLAPDSVILVQDYHFALLPRMIRTRSDQPKIGLFWHIPWPNPEAFGICPWNRDLLRGMLGADVIGFHTQYHCNNFLESCNRYLEARIDYEHFSVTMGDHSTEIRAFPIGIETTPVKFLTDVEREQLKIRYGIKTPWVAVGVDRLDYTKGLVERVEAVERFLEKYPKFVGKFTFVQMGSPSRSQIPAYQQLADQLEKAVTRVNGRYSQPPIIFLPSHHDWEEIQNFYQLGDICLVTSLHDGMNLVAKEYVWCQRPDRGALILSKFTGASRELTEAFIVNPYSIEEMADAIHAALLLSPEERFNRMASMRAKVRSRSAYHWASDLIRATISKTETTETAGLTKQKFAPTDLGRQINL